MMNEIDEAAYRIEFLRWSRTLAQSSVNELADRLAVHRLEDDSGIAYHRAHVYARPEKVKARGLVLEALSRAWRNGQTRILTMPGALWHFEEALLDARESSWWRARSHTERTHIIAIERNEYLHRAGLLKAPCSKGSIYAIEAPVWSSGSYRAGPIKQFHRASLEDVDFDELAPINAAWLDFSGPMYPAVIEATERLWRLRSMGRLIVTAMGARWPMGDFDMFGWLKGFDGATVFHDHRYQSGMIPMLQFGIEKPIIAPPPPERPAPIKLLYELSPSSRPGGWRE
jgi:hypothetical protein